MSAADEFWVPVALTNLEAIAVKSACVAVATSVGGPGVMAALPNLRIGKPRFMGAHSGKLWLDWPMFGGWLVIFAGRRSAPRLPTAYWSPDGTTGHVKACSVLGFRGVIQRERRNRAFDEGYAFREQVERGEVDVV